MPSDLRPPFDDVSDFKIFQGGGDSAQITSESASTLLQQGQVLLQVCLFFLNCGHPSP